MNLPPYDPVERHLLLERLITRGAGDEVERKYWRFRADRWYGGIATGDCVGCGLACRFCWVNDKAFHNPGAFGSFCKPCDVASRLRSIASSRGYRQARVSGGEPTIARAHLLQLLDHLESLQPLSFILETNGILIGHDRRYARELSRFRFLSVRVSLKGCNASDFERLTGASPNGFSLQLQALKNLVEEGVNCHAAVMRSFSSSESFEELLGRLSEIDPSLAGNIEMEEVIMYPRVAARIERFGLRPVISHRPDEIPTRLI